MAKNKVKEELIAKIAEEYGYDKAEVRHIVDSQYSFLRKTIEHGAFDSVRLPYFGRFHVNPYRLHKLNLTKVKKK